MSGIGSILQGLWRGLDGLRRFLHLLLLLALFGFVVGALSTSLPDIPPRAALVIAPEGQIVEQLSGDPIERAIAEARGFGRSETLLRDLTDAIRAAAKDERIQAILLDLEQFQGAGQPTLEELARALDEFRTSGKKVIAHGQAFLQHQYYLAAQADEVYLDPLGYVLLDGYESYRMFFKEALEKLGVTVNVFRVGQYKSAVEVFTRMDMSPEEREESLAYLNALWGSYQRATTEARQLNADTVANYVATLPQTVAQARGDTAEVARSAGLITGMRTRIDVEQQLIELVGRDEHTDSFNAVSHWDYISVVRAEEAVRAGTKPRIGVVVAAGEILDGDQPPGTIGGESTARMIREARADDGIRAVVLRIDSPGGSMLASEQIYREILALKEAGKPVIVSMGDVAASGGYYIAAPADEIWASPATITGSIGIFAVIPTVQNTLDKLGISVDGVGTTGLSGQFRLDRPLGDDARMLLQATIERGYDEFLARVGAGRKMTREQVDQIAQGRVWAGTDAQRVGLVDQLGSFNDAIQAAAKRANLTDYEIDYIEPQLSWAQQFALQLKMKAAAFLFESLSDSRSRELVRVMRQLDPVQREVERLSRFTTPNRLYAYCFCSP